MNASCLPVPESELTDLALHCACGDHYLADEMAQHVRVQFWYDLYDSTKANGKFLAWARVCMWHYRTNNFRDRFRAVGGDDQLDLPDPDSDPSAADLNIDLTTPFGAADLAEVRSWKPRHLVVLLAFTGLWPKLPQHDQRRAIRNLSIANLDELSNLLDLSEGERRRVLATVLGLTVENVRQILCRYLDRIHGLRLVRELRAA